MGRGSRWAAAFRFRSGVAWSGHDCITASLSCEELALCSDRGVRTAAPRPASAPSAARIGPAGQAEFLRQFALIGVGGGSFRPRTMNCPVAAAVGAPCAQAQSAGHVGADAPGEARRARRPRRLRCHLAERLGRRLDRPLSGVLSDKGTANSSASNSARLARYLAVERLPSVPCLSRRPSAVHKNHHHVRPRFLRWVSKTANRIAPPTRQGDFPIVLCLTHAAAGSTPGAPNLLTAIGE
ncbi:hypothetical protein JOE52_005068 [Bradyrhizobium canariense]|nr:hypothetical protein [Bradyrhizobium canariense]